VFWILLTIKTEETIAGLQIPLITDFVQHSRRNWEECVKEWDIIIKYQSRGRRYSEKPLKWHEDGFITQQLTDQLGLRL